MPNTPADEQRINAIRFLSVDAVDKANQVTPGYRSERQPKLTRSGRVICASTRRIRTGSIAIASSFRPATDLLCSTRCSICSGFP